MYEAGSSGSDDRAVSMGALLFLIPFFLATIALVLSIPVAVLSVQIVAALLARRSGPVSQPRAEKDDTSTLAVVIPAHDEGENVVPTIRDASVQLGPRGRVIVVADNCSDETAAIARRAGAEVLVRNEPLLVGKGYALSHAVQALANEPPDHVAFVDADCRLSSHMLQRLQDACRRSGRPVQALNLMRQAPDSPIDHRLAEFFWLIRNYVRPLGLQHLGLPVQLLGTGMMFPWRIIASAPLASGHLAEDLNLGIDLARAGHAAIFIPEAGVTSFFPDSEKGTDSQRERWIGGHIRTIGRRIPLLWEAVTTRNWAFFAIVLDVLVPPLSLLGLLLLAVLVASALLAVSAGLTAALIVSVINSVALAAGLFATWLVFGREVCPAGAIFGVVMATLAARVRLYTRLARGNVTRRWVRTDRRR
jgi:cellulose synthase/poly-beta-1,6-N-acetylglucosamine synthase-like glycosyltransferase